MEYVLYRYQEQPTAVAAVAATADPRQAAVLARAWARTAPEEVIVAIDERPVIHHAPRLPLPSWTNPSPAHTPFR